jgi:hypothetical protein
MICFTFSSAAAISFSCVFRLKKSIRVVQIWMRPGRGVAGMRRTVRASLKDTERLAECKAKRAGLGVGFDLWDGSPGCHICCGRNFDLGFGE